MITDLVSFDMTGLAPERSSPPERRWATDRGLTVVLTVGEYVPVFPATAAGQSAMRNHYRQRFAEAGAGLVELTYNQVDGCQAVRTITKVVMDPTTGWGRRFVGFLEIATANACILLRVDCSETGTTGVRETGVTFRLLSSGALTFKPVPPGEESRMRRAADTNGWILDPQDPTPPHLALCAADDRQFDAEFPDHPLSLVRSFLDRAQSSMSIAPELKSAGAYAEGSKTKRWWKLW